MKASKTYKGQMAVTDDAPALIRALPALASIGIGRAKAYDLLNSGALPAVKLGKATMLRVEDWQEFIKSLPAYQPAATVA